MSSLCLGESCDDIDLVFSTPHDHPPQWAAMLTAYLDESSGSADGFYVLGGFLGNDHAWKQCKDLWSATLNKSGRTSLHMNELRLNASNAERRYKGMLDALAKIPSKSGLWGLYGTVRKSDYESLVAGNVAQIAMDGYPLALWTAVPLILRVVPPGERVKLVFEQQIEHAAVREMVLSQASRMPEYMADGGKSKLAGWESVPESMLLEPSDYLCYAVLQDHIDKCSQKARLTAGILRAGTVLFSHMDLTYTHNLIDKFKQEIGVLPSLDGQEKKETMQVMRKMASLLKEANMSEDEFAKFNQAMESILKADPAQVKAQMEAEKEEREERRKAKKEDKND